VTPNSFEYYETPQALTRYLHSQVVIEGLCVEPCAGSGAIVEASGGDSKRSWLTNDIDRRWDTQWNFPAEGPSLWHFAQKFYPPDWVVTNPPFSLWREIAEQALKHARVGVAMYLRASCHEVLKTGPRRTWMAEHPPTGILWLPRFAYQRSPTTGKWTTDSMSACWVIWLKDPAAQQFIRYAPESVLDELEAETPAYRQRMDAIMEERDGRRSA
jgi:hypothetical protein